MSQSITTNFTSGQTLTAAQLNTAFGQAAKVMAIAAIFSAVNIGPAIFRSIFH